MSVSEWLNYSLQVSMMGNVGQTWAVNWATWDLSLLTRDWWVSHWTISEPNLNGLWPRDSASQKLQTILPRISEGHLKWAAWGNVFYYWPVRFSHLYLRFRFCWERFHIRLVGKVLQKESEQLDPWLCHWWGPPTSNCGYFQIYYPTVTQKSNSISWWSMLAKDRSMGLVQSC